MEDRYLDSEEAVSLQEGYEEEAEALEGKQEAFIQGFVCGGITALLVMVAIGAFIGLVIGALSIG